VCNGYIGTFTITPKKKANQKINCLELDKEIPYQLKSRTRPKCEYNTNNDNNIKTDPRKVNKNN